MNPNQRNQRSAFTLLDFMVIIVVVMVVAAIALPQLAKRYARASKISCTNNLKQVALSYRQWAIDNGDEFPMKVSVTNGGSMELIEGAVVYSTFLVMSNELVTPKLLICPEETNTRRVTANTFEQSNPRGVSSGRIPFTNDNNVSYFVGVDADRTNPKSILGGDDNFVVGGTLAKHGLLLLHTNSPIQWTKKRHVSRGNIAVADGSVTVISNSAITEVLVRTGMATNRLALP
jgi:type II secretory pathway pseudopilin PulG